MNIPNVGMPEHFYVVGLSYTDTDTQDTGHAPMFETSDTKVLDEDVSVNLYRLFFSQDDAIRFKDIVSAHTDLDVQEDGFTNTQWCVTKVDSKDLGKHKTLLLSNLSNRAQDNPETYVDKRMAICMVTCVYREDVLVEQDILFQNIRTKDQMN